MIDAINPIIMVRIHTDGKSAIGLQYSYKNKKMKIKEIVMGMGICSKAIPYDKHLQAHVECRAEVLPDGKLRII